MGGHGQPGVRDCEQIQMPHAGDYGRYLPIDHPDLLHGRPLRSRRNWSTSVDDGNDGCAPKRVTETAAAATAYSAASRSPIAWHKPTASAPTKQSPAAVVSTASTGKDGMCFA